MAKINLENGDTYKSDAKLSCDQLKQKITGNIRLRGRARKGAFPHCHNLEEDCNREILRFRNEIKRRIKK